MASIGVRYIWMHRYCRRRVSKRRSRQRRDRIRYTSILSTCVPSSSLKCASTISCTTRSKIWLVNRIGNRSLVDRTSTVINCRNDERTFLVIFEFICYSFLLYHRGLFQRRSIKRARRRDCCVTRPVDGTSFVNLSSTQLFSPRDFSMLLHQMKFFFRESGNFECFTVEWADRITGSFNGIVDVREIEAVSAPRWITGICKTYIILHLSG
mmetsp:Transcript_6248/g.15467  ORF Transcript_6248/g.15467 Transcript_6248/m.15467 type:complete len:210 (-) Transcript_6248:919-1548(-)